MVVSVSPFPAWRPEAAQRERAVVADGNFDGTRAYVLGRMDEAGASLQRAIELLSMPLPGGPIPHASPYARQLGAIIGATMGASAALQESLLWYGDLRGRSTLPEPHAQRESAVLAHVLTGMQGVTRADGYARALLETGDSPPDVILDMWREQAMADAADAATFIGEARAMVEALEQRATDGVTRVPARAPSAAA